MDKKDPPVEPLVLITAKELFCKYTIDQIVDLYLELQEKRGVVECLSSEEQLTIMMS